MPPLTYKGVRAAADAAWNLFLRGNQTPTCNAIAKELAKEMGQIGYGPSSVKESLPRIKKELENHPERKAYPPCLITELYYQEHPNGGEPESVEQALRYYPRKVKSHGIFFVTDPESPTLEASIIRNSETATGKVRADVIREINAWEYGLVDAETLERMITQYTLGPTLVDQFKTVLKILGEHKDLLAAVQETIESLPQLPRPDEDDEGDAA